MDSTTSKGFSRPTTTPTPDELFDVWLPQLSGSELKVLLYIVRRTLGFKKDADTISISQICNGITTRDGRVLDQGTGLSRNTAIQAIKGLTEKGLVRVERGQDERGIHETNTYRLCFRGDDDDQTDTVDGTTPSPDQGSAKSEPGVVRKSNYGSAKNDPGVVQKSNPQQTDTQQTDQQETEPPLPPAEEAPPETETAGAGGGDISLPSDPISPEGEDSLPDEQEEACRLLVAFGVWEKPARRLVTSLRLTPELVQHACAALEAESAQGKPINNPGAILCHRLLQGWVPPEPEPPPEEDITGTEEEQFALMPRVERMPLPPIVDRHGREHEAYAWFASLMGEVQLCMPRETFDAWLRGAVLEDVNRQEGEATRLTIRLANRFAYEWVSQRLHTAIQRMVDAMLGCPAEIIYTAPELEEAERNVI
ncbi:MAG: hypothetical protein JXB30_15745 [Anaerolineae bacterium]|nr:hypothetical protein [Anaerolineae bacterium]